MGSFYKKVSSSLCSMKFLVVLSIVGLSLSAPLPAEEEAPVIKGIPYGALAGFPFQPALPYGALANPFKAATTYNLPAATTYNLPGPVLALNPLETGLTYPLAEAYIHDAAGDVADNAIPEAEAYVHDTTGDVADNSYPEAEAYVHDTTGDA